MSSATAFVFAVKQRFVQKYGQKIEQWCWNLKTFKTTVFKLQSISII